MYWRSDEIPWEVSCFLYLQMFEVGGSLYELAIPLQHVSVLNRQFCVLSVRLLQVR